MKIVEQLEEFHARKEIQDRAMRGDSRANEKMLDEVFKSIQIRRESEAAGNDRLGKESESDSDSRDSEMPFSP